MWWTSQKDSVLGPTSAKKTMEEQVLFEFGSKDAEQCDDKGPWVRDCRGIVDEEANVLIMLCGGEMGRIWQICLETKQWNFLVAHGNNDSIIQQGSELLRCPMDMCMDRKRVIHVLCSSFWQSSIQCVDRTQRRTWTLCENLPELNHMVYSYRDDCLYLSSMLDLGKLFQYGLDGNWLREIRLHSSPSVPLEDLISGLCEMPSGALLVQHGGYKLAEVDMHTFDWDCPVVRPVVRPCGYDELYRSIFVACPEGSIWVNEYGTDGAHNLVRVFREGRVVVKRNVYPIAMGSDGKLFVYETDKGDSPRSITVLHMASLSCRQVMSTLARQLVNVAGTLLPDPLWMIVAGYAIWPFGFSS